jgi:hypothetical protein
MSRAVGARSAMRKGSSLFLCRRAIAGHSSFSIAEGSLAGKISFGKICSGSGRKRAWCELSNDLVASLPAHRIPEVATLRIGMETGDESAVDCGGSLTTTGTLLKQN